ncbi:hypothetical protein [Rhizobium leguminosarum]|uniref:hypothetical protein n=1 Tax=Rhizobium leguminosarum TaxID=384 RepID=UPI0013BE7AC9|nr:hypothetical protein [Rhizobium leguminosarum]NEH72328.1 hypothetical protein [Rhizobium leguminosarum]
MGDDIDWLTEIAARAKADAERAKRLRRALDVLGRHSSGEVVSFSTDFMGPHIEHETDAEISITLKAMWPAVRDDTIRRVTDELDAIVRRYQPLLQEPTP